MNFRSALLPVSLSALLASCGSLPLPGNGGGSNYLAGIGVTSPANGPVNPVEASKFWDGDSVSGPPMIRIKRSEQKAYFYKGQELVGVSPVSSGDSAHRTPAGTFKVTEKSPDHASSLYGRIIDVASGQTVVADADTRKHKPRAGQKYVGAPMPNFLRFNHGIGMHAGHLPGYPASHGCVRLPADMAEKFYQHAPTGTPVIVE